MKGNNETYKQMKERHEKEYSECFNALKPLVFYAFGRDQQNDAIAAYTAAGGKMDELTSAGAGLFGSHDEIKKLFDICERHDDEIAEALTNREFAKSAFIYEMRNHEYIYSYNDMDVLHALGLDERKLNDDMRDCYAEARSEYINAC